MRLVAIIKKYFSLTGVAAAAAKRAVVSSGTTNLASAKSLANRIASAVEVKASGLASLTLSKIKAKMDAASASGKSAQYEQIVQEDVVGKIKNIEALAKRTEADGAGKAAEAAEAAEAAKAAEAGKTGKAGEADGAAMKKKKQEEQEKQEKRAKYLRIVGVLLVVASASAATGLVMKSYADKAKEEREQCLALWETKYMDIIKDENGELLEIDSAEKWSQNLLYLEKAIESHDSVNGDPEKANELLVGMYNELVDCISNDTSLVGAFLNGISRDVGNALGNVIDPVAAPLDKLINSTSDLFKNISIGLAILAATMIIFLGVWLVMKRSRRMNEYRIGPFGHNSRRSGGGSGGGSGGSGGRVSSRRWRGSDYQYRRIDP